MSSENTDDIVQHPGWHQAATGARQATTVESYAGPRVSIGGGVYALRNDFPTTSRDK